jgi:phosphate-selective porin
MKYGFAFLTACILAGGLWGQDETDPLGINARWNNGLELKTNDGNTSLKLGGRIMLEAQSKAVRTRASLRLGRGHLLPALATDENLLTNRTLVQ